MRKIIYIFIFLLLSICSTYGQSIEQRYSANLDFYVGTWRYTNTATNEEFTIKLRKSVYTAYNISKDCVVGTYVYKKNGVVVLDNTSEYMNDRSVEGVSIPIYATNARAAAAAVNPNKLETTILDYGILRPSSNVPKYGMGSITIISTGNPKKIQWVLKDPPGARIVGYSAPMGFSIPTDIILTKID